MKSILATLFLLSTVAVFGQQADSLYIVENYTKKEVYIPMRDGTRLYTAIYSPKANGNYPVLMKRTCYSIRPYGEENFPTRLGPSSFLMRSGYIFVYQDVRGRWMSEGDFDNMTPHIPGNDVKNTTDIDESSDTFDTIDWLIKNLANFNGKVGQWGISYPGFYTAAALPEAHPALVASSPQAPISDFYFDDFHHMGAFLQSYLLAFPVFGHQTEPTKESWYADAWNNVGDIANTEDGYTYGLKLGPLKNADEILKDNFFWKQVKEHPNYDEFWQKRSILPHLEGIDHAVMTVGGWYDAEDLFGPLNIYKTIEERNKEANNTIVMGPWSHGDWARERGYQAVNHIYFGDSVSTYYQKNIEMPFFEYHLKGKGNPNAFEAHMFDTGLKAWKSFTTWPPVDIKPVQLGFEEGGKLLINSNGEADARFVYTSDPNKPVPYTSETEGVTFTPRRFMTDDQRHASKRPDVLTFESDVLKEDLTLAGEIMAKLKVAISSTDADFVVKLIDVYSDDAKPSKITPEHVSMPGYQQLVRHEVFRGRFRNSFEKPEPFEPNVATEVKFPLQDILHTFKKGHRVMIQIHSTWFPYIDRNPQKYVENIFEADAEDFQKAEITVYGSSVVEIGKNDLLETPLPNLEVKK